MRLIDLHVDWLLQYTSETVVFDPALYPGVETRQAQAAGYLQDCRAAILSCYRRLDDWQSQANPWNALGQLISRLEAEFSGRLLIGSDDFHRWQSDRDGMTWGLIGVEGFDFLIRSTEDLSRLSQLFDRGVRLFQPVYSEQNELAGSSIAGDDRGLTDLGFEFLEALLEVSPQADGPRPIFDLAHLNQRATSQVFDWFATDPERRKRIVLAYSHGAPAHAGYETPRAISIENLTRLRSLGGFVGVGVSPPFFSSLEEVKQAIETIRSIPFEGREGYEGIAIGTDFLGVSRTLLDLATAEEVIAWIQANFDRPVAKDLLHDNALSLFARTTGVRLGG